MIYIRYFADGRVYYEHYKPFHPIDGLGQTKEKLEESGHFVDSIPVPEMIPRKIPVLKYNSDTEELFYEYEDAPPSEVDRISELERELLVSKEDNVSNMLAITELYELILGGTT